MGSNIEKSNGLSRKLSIQVSVEDISNEFDSMYQELRDEAHLKGFRKVKLL